MIVMHGETLWSPALQPMDDDESPLFADEPDMLYGEFDSQLKMGSGNLRAFDMNPGNRLRVALISLASHGQLPASAIQIW